MSKVLAKTETPRSHTIRIIVLIAAFLVCLANFGHHIEPPFPLSITTDAGQNAEQGAGQSAIQNAEDAQSTVQNSGVAFYCIKENAGGIAIDSGMTRLIFLDAQGRANAIRDREILDDSVVYYADCAILDDGAYVLAFERYSDTGYVKCQRVYQYNFQGTKGKIVWEQQYSPSGPFIKNPLMKSLDATADGKVLGVVANEDASRIDIVQVAPESLSEPTASFAVDFGRAHLLDAEYNAAINALATITDTGIARVNHQGTWHDVASLEDPDALTRCVRIEDDGTWQPLTAEKKGSEAPAVIPFSPTLIAWTLLFWISVACIIVLLGAFVARRVRAAITQTKGDSMLNVVAACVAVACVLGVSSFYGYQMQNKALEDNVAALKSLALNAKSTPAGYLAERIESINNVRDLQSDEWYELRDYAEQLYENSARQGQNIEYGFVKITGDDVKSATLITCTSVNEWTGGAFSSLDYETMAKSAKMKDAELVTHKSIFGSSISAYAPVQDATGTTVGFVLLSSDVLLFLADVLSDASRAFVSLLVGIVVLFLLFSELRGVIASWRTRLRLTHEREKHPEIAFSPLFSFLTVFVTSFDSALMVLIAKDIITAQGGQNMAALLGVPAFCLAAGMTVGKPVFNTLSKHMSIRPLLLGTCALLGISYIVCFYAVNASDFWMYCAALLVGAVFTGMISAIRFYMPLLAPNDQVRFEINSNGSTASISGNVLSVATAGIVAEGFGSASIYLMVLVPVMVLIALALFVFPRGEKYYMHGSQTGRKGNLRESLRFFLNPAFVAFAVFMLMTDTLATGYKSFMFPLFTSDAGISKAMISNLVVFGNFIAYLVNKNSKKIVQKVDFLHASILCTVATGAVFLSFLINSSVAWATAVIAIIMVVSKLSSLCNDMLWPRLCRSTGFSEQTANRGIQYFNDFTYMIRSFVLSALMTLGISAACMWMGIFMLVGSAIFFVLSKKSGFAIRQD